jgi:hypothetical protein
MKVQPDDVPFNIEPLILFDPEYDFYWWRGRIDKNFKCPYGKIGDVLWVRETWFKMDGQFIYKADVKYPKSLKWKPSIFMPREACRLRIEITDIRVERLHDISQEDAIKEGIECIEKAPVGDGNLYRYYLGRNIDGVRFGVLNPIESFKSLWQSINDNWDKNPFVWVIEFKKIN